MTWRNRAIEAVAALLLVVIGQQVLARTPEEIVQHHVNAVRRGDVRAVLQDYASDAIIVVPPTLNPRPAGANGVFRGTSQISELYHFYAKGNHGDASAKMETSNEMLGPDILLCHWIVYRGTPHEFAGADTFVFRHGKIAFQDVQPPRGHLD